MSEGLLQLIVFGGPLAVFVLGELLWFIVEKCRDSRPEERGFEVVRPVDPSAEAPAGSSSPDEED